MTTLTAASSYPSNFGANTPHYGTFGSNLSIPLSHQNAPPIIVHPSLTYPSGSTPQFTNSNQRHPVVMPAPVLAPGYLVAPGAHAGVPVDGYRIVDEEFVVPRKKGKVEVLMTPRTPS